MPFKQEHHWDFVGEIYTRYLLLSYKPELSDTLDNSLKNSESEHVVVVIPGNPGNELFYEQFSVKLLERLARSSGRAAQIYVVCHINHVPYDFSNVLNEEEDCNALIRHQSNNKFDLEQQFEHKLQFCRNFFKRTEGKMILVGHSIGAYLALRVRNELKNEGIFVHSCCALFPTVELIAETPNGLWIDPIMQMIVKYDGLAAWAFAFLKIVPLALKRAIVKFFVGFNSHGSVVEAAVELCQPYIWSNICHMTHSEMKIVREFNNEWLVDEPESIFFYYGKNDGWSPLKHADDMIKRHPIPENVKIDENGCEHAFVIRHSDVVANTVAEFVLRSLN